MKNVVCFIFLFILFTVSTYADDGVNTYEYGKPIIITEVVENTTGHPCLNCECNLTLFYPSPNESIVFYSTLMTNNNNGVYNATLTNLSLDKDGNIYPLVLHCNSTSHYGVSELKGIKVIWNMFNFTSIVIIPIALSALSAYFGFKIRPEHVILKWIFSLIAVLFFISFSFLGGIIAEQSGINGLSIFFDALTYVTGFLFVFMLFYTIFLFTKYDKKIKQREQQGYG